MPWKQLFNIAWRLAVLALPWQTRWIMTVPTIADSPWEQGMIAIYASWVLMVAAVITGIGLRYGMFLTGSASVLAGLRRHRKTLVFPVTAVLVLIVASLFTASATATALWWSHAILLVLFFWVLWVNRVSSIQLISWFIISLMPHVLLALWQFLDQQINGSVLMGFGDKRAWMRGVSVVEYGEYRIMRAYGGFPHPNILGGWIAVAFAFFPMLIRQAGRTRLAFAWTACAALSAMALVFTFSRGAWIAAAVAGTIAFVLAWKRSVSHDERHILLTSALVVLPVVLIALTSQWPAVQTRLQGSERLERWSIEQRTNSFRDGWDAFILRPWAGWGPGAALKGVEALGREQPPAVPTLLSDGSWMSWHTPLEPPHIAPLAASVEVGAIGMLALCVLLFLWLRFLIRSKTFVSALPLLAAIAIISFTDHYFWTVWAGQTLLAFLVTVSLLSLHVAKND